MMHEENKKIVQNAEVESVDIEAESLKKDASILSKHIKVEKIKEDLAFNFLKAVEMLEVMQHDVEAKKLGILDRQKLIETKLSSFQKSGLVNVDDVEHQKSNQSINEFAKILDAMVAEINTDIVFYRSLLTSDHPEYVSVVKTASDSFEVYIQQCIINIKRYVKTVNRDLAVSYSRYNYGFDVQMKRIVYIEQVLKRMSA